MKTWEALKALGEGKKVRLKYWESGRYIYRTESGRILDDTGDVVYINLTSGIIDEEWEECGWGETKEKVRVVYQVRCPCCFTYSCREESDVHFIYCPHCGEKVVK